MYINYDHYRIFYYVAKYGSFTGAAQFLLNNQPNITRTVKKLEKELGCTLFIRSNRGVKLTPEGEKLYAHIAVAMEHIAMGEEEILQERGLKCGVVSIGGTEVALNCFLLPVLKDFHCKYEGIRIRISNHTTPQAISALNRGLVDLAVVTSPFELKENIKSIELKQFREIALCGEKSKRLTESPISLGELNEYPIISLAPNTTTHEFYSRLFAKHGLNLSPDIEAATADQLLPLIKAGLGIGFVPEDLAAEALAQNRVFEVKLIEEIPKRSVCLLKNKEKPMSIAAKILEKAITANRA